MLRRFSVNFAIFSMFIDAAVIAALLWLMAYFRPYLGDWAEGLPFIKEISQQIRLPLALYFIFPAIWVMIMLFFSVYDGRKNLRVVDEFTSITLSAMFAWISLAGILYLSYRDVSRLLFLTFCISAYLILLGWRIPARLMYQWRSQSQGRMRHVLILGAGVVGKEVEREFDHHEQQIRVVGFLDDDPVNVHKSARILGGLDQTRAIVKKHHVEDVVFSLPLRAYKRMSEVLEALYDLPVQIWIVPDYFQWALHHAGVEEFGDIPLLNVRAPALTEHQRMNKRLFDLAIGLPLLILLLPLMGLIALAIWLDDGSPVLFRQKRVGENGRLFVLYKFRTMVKNAEDLHHLVEQVDDQGNIIHKRRKDPRITRLGRFLRRWSLDELPQIFNVLRGTMSLVGPRPELPHLVEKYQPWQRKRFAVPRGITGWWQIRGRRERLMHLHTDDDLYYIQNFSIWLDIQILIKTFWIVLRGKGAY